MMKVFMTPKAAELGIGRVVEAYHKHLPKFGIDLVDALEQADLIATHAGSRNAKQTDVAHIHGLYPTANTGARKVYFAANLNVVEALRNALCVTVPSAWVARCLQRDMLIAPHIVPHGLDIQAWSYVPRTTVEGPVLWAKGHNADVCVAGVVDELAKCLPKRKFVTTIGREGANIKAVGKLPLPEMHKLMETAGVYLATSKETFGIQTLEAMALGVPVVGYNWGATPEVVGDAGYLCEPGDLEALAANVEAAYRNAALLSELGRARAQMFSWEAACIQVVHVYETAMTLDAVADTVAVIIPCYNYGKWLGRAIDSVLKQEHKAAEIIVVDDGSTDDTAKVAAKYPTVRYIRTERVGVAEARNTGIRASKSKYAACLDADDYWLPHFISSLLPSLQDDRSLGVAYGGLKTLNSEGKINESRWPVDFDYRKQVDRRNCVPSSNLFRRAAWERVGGFRGKYTPAEDAEFWLRIASAGFGIKHAVDAPVYVYNAHAGSLSRSMKEPDWCADKPYAVYSGLASVVAPSLSDMATNPARDYDAPYAEYVIKSDNVGEVANALDGLQTQIMWNWEATVLSEVELIHKPTGLPMRQVYPFATFVVSADGFWAKEFSIAPLMLEGQWPSGAVSIALLYDMLALYNDYKGQSGVEYKTLRMYPKTWDETRTKFVVLED